MGVEWRPAVVPGTVAVSMGTRDPDGHPDYDAHDWWYRCQFAAPEPGPEGRRVRLRFDGLATLAQVWLNDTPILSTENMFQAHVVDVTDSLQRQNNLHLAFRSVARALSAKRPRPQWKTKLVDHQQIRWLRTTLLGRMPGWTPRIHAVGPWRGIWLETAGVLTVERLEVIPRVEDGRPSIAVGGLVTPLDPGVEIRHAVLLLGEQQIPLERAARGASLFFATNAALEDIPLWWPHTHGTPQLLPCRIRVESSRGPVEVDCGRIGFREVTVDRMDGVVRFRVNGVPVFCRGACWTTNDIVSLVGPEDGLRATLRLAAGAGANMIRVGGTMVYETDRFYALCDELGIMVWQDFMFANMDYPVSDTGFRASVEAEAEQQLLRLQRHPSVVAYCGGSEVEQQAAMCGAPRDVWSNDFFSVALRRLVECRHPGVPYWPSTPTGGPLPFHVGQGLAHYYGVGAYRRPPDDVRLARVKFTPECLGFSNVPEPGDPAGFGGAAPALNHPDWKQGVPRDAGADWDFEDVRDHYLQLLYQVDPADLRGRDPRRYLTLSRTVSGRVMEQAYHEWRSAESCCGGALVWFLRDLRPGAGWGILDSENRPKAVYYHLRRAWSSRTIFLLERGLDGVRACVRNDHQEMLEGDIELLVIARGSTVTARASRRVSVHPRSAVEVDADDLLGGFYDVTDGYRFGPPKHEAVVARLLDPRSGEVLAEDVYRSALSVPTEVRAIRASLSEWDQGRLLLSLSSEGLAYDVRIDIGGHRPDDNYFTLTPGRVRSVLVHRIGTPTHSFSGILEASNLSQPVRLRAPLETTALIQ